MSLVVEVWRDPHGVTWEVVSLGSDGLVGGCLVREVANALDRADGDVREGPEVIARFSDLEGARAFLRSEGFEPS